MATLPTVDAYVRPKYYTADERSVGYRSVWVKHVSPTTSETPNPESRMLLAPWSSRSGIKSDTWWIAMDHWVDSAWDPATQGAWGTGPLNLHNTSYDEEGIGWNWGTGTSSIQYDYISGNFYVHIEHGNFPSSRLLVKSSYAKNTWHSILMKLTLGRTDVTSYNGQTVSPGRVQIWLDGSDTPIDSGPTNTVQRAVNPSTGNTVLQGAMMCWGGHYTKNSTSELHLKFTAPRVGRTLSECLGDTNLTFKADWVGNILDPNGVGPDLGPSSYTIGTSRSTTDFLLPPSLGGSAPPVTPTVFGAWTTAQRINAAVESGTPDQPTTVLEHFNGEWTGVQRINATSFPTPPEGEPVAPSALAHGVKRTLTFTGKR